MNSVLKGGSQEDQFFSLLGELRNPVLLDPENSLKFIDKIHFYCSFFVELRDFVYLILFVLNKKGFMLNSPKCPW